jgi:uncharacterized integral membrane protein (TIGR00698 family)
VDLVPGLALATLIAIVSNFGNQAIVIGGQKPVSAVVISIILGMAIKTFIGQRKELAPGLSFAVKKILRLAIILLGFDLTFQAVVKTGAGTLGIIVVTVVVGILSTVWLGKALGLRDELSTLIGTGTAICGATAIVAAAPAVGADDSDISYAVGTITTFGIIAIFLYPLLGRALAMTDTQFGTWAGTAVHETAQVLAAGMAFSETAGKLAAVVKLTRTALLAPLVMILGAIFAKKHTGQVSWKSAMKSFPYFVFWFLAASVVRSLLDSTFGTASPDWWKWFLVNAKEASKFLIVVAMASTGLMTDFAKMRQVGMKPFFVGMIASVVVGTVTLVLIRL